MDMQLILQRINTDLIQGFHGAGGLTRGAAKGRKIMLSHQHLRRRMHHGHIQRARIMIHPMGPQGAGGWTMQNPVTIPPLGGGKTGVKSLRHGLGGQNSHGPWPQMGIDPMNKRPQRQSIMIHMNDLTTGMNPRIGAASGMNDFILSREFFQRILQNPLNRHGVGLILPTGKGRAVVFQNQLNAQGLAPWSAETLSENLPFSSPFFHCAEPMWDAALARRRPPKTDCPKSSRSGQRY
jgi:hypothetical protein